jgi:hypothetical protein
LPLNAIAAKKSLRTVVKICLMNSIKVRLEWLCNSYIEYLLPEDQYIPDYDITLGIDGTKLPKTQSKKEKI